MQTLGLDPADNAARIAFGQRVIDDFKLEMTTFVRGFHPDATIFYNAGHISPFARQGFPAYSHLELESASQHWPMGLPALPSHGTLRPNPWHG